jgi:hypothetical protein
MAQDYNYTKTPVSVNRLTLEIIAANITSANFQYINFNDPSLDIIYDAALSTADKTTLDGVVSAHTGAVFVEDYFSITKTASTNSNSSSYVVLNGMTTGALVAGTYQGIFVGTFSTNVPLLTNPGLFVSLFHNGVQIADTEMSHVSNNGGAAFVMCTVKHGVVAEGGIIDVRWKTNGSGNTVTCLTRSIHLTKIK